MHLSYGQENTQIPYKNDTITPSYLHQIDSPSAALVLLHCIKTCSILHQYTASPGAVDTLYIPDHLCIMLRGQHLTQCLTWQLGALTFQRSNFDSVSLVKLIQCQSVTNSWFQNGRGSWPRQPVEAASRGSRSRKHRVPALGDSVINSCRQIDRLN